MIYNQGRNSVPNSNLIIKTKFMLGKKEKCNIFCYLCFIKFAPLFFWLNIDTMSGHDNHETSNTIMIHPQGLVFSNQ